MPVYVDDLHVRRHKVILFRMAADTVAELRAMAGRIGGGLPSHFCNCYYISQTLRARAVAAGALQITRRECDRILNRGPGENPA